LLEQKKKMIQSHYKYMEISMELFVCSNFSEFLPFWNFVLFLFFRGSLV
jgi:hypothetical protein